MITLLETPAEEVALTSARDSPQASDRTFGLLLVSTLTLFVLLVHGYHPYAEDGGIYVAGIKHLLNPQLYPAFTPFVTEHLRFSLFAPLVAALVRTTRLPLPLTLFAFYIASIWLTLYSAWLLATDLVPTRTARAGAITLLACWFTLPIAGTALYLADPYLTARSLSSPLAILALHFVINRKTLFCTLTLLAATLLHPLMAAYAFATILIFFAARRPVPQERRTAFAVLLAVALAAAALLQHFAPPESPAYLQVALTRYYWFPFWWQWYEQLGLIAPLILFAALLRRPGTLPSWPPLARSAIALALIAILIAVCFSRVHLATHLVARLQPLRAFQMVYILLVLLLGAWLGETVLRARTYRWLALLATMGALMFNVQRATYPASSHLELPWQESHPSNPWLQAFLWARSHTPIDAVFALDAHYIDARDEDAQCFRAIAERSALPDYSKDGGEAAITPSLTEAWTTASNAQTRLDLQPDANRLANLKPLGATWLILQSRTSTTFTCPYSNATVKLCSLPGLRFTSREPPEPPPSRSHPEPHGSTPASPGPSTPSCCKTP